MLWLAVSACVLLWFGAPASGQAADLSPGDVLAKTKKATGGDAWDGVRSLHIQLTVSTAGLSGTEESWTDVLTGRYMDSYQIGPMSGDGGFDGEVVWSRDTSGQVRPEEGGDEKVGAVNEAYRRSLAYWYPDRSAAAMEHLGTKEENARSFHVLRLTPEGGRPYDVWVDADTWLFDRIVEPMALETRTTFLSEYREIGELRFPHAIRSTNGEERYDVHAAVTSIEVNPHLEDGMFAMPVPPPPDFHFSGDSTSTTIPFNLVNNHIYLDVTLNGKGPYQLLCDTGGANLVTPTLAEELGLVSEGAIQGRGVGEKSEDMGIMKVESLGVGNVTLDNQIFYVVPLESFEEVEGVPFNGLIGYEVFKRFVVRIDYEQNRLTLTLPSAFVYEGKGTVVPFQFNGHKPEVEGSVDGVVGKFGLDTGSRGTVDLHVPFVKKHDLDSRLEAGPECVTGWGVGGPVRSMVSRAATLRLGTVEVQDVIVEVSRQTKGSFTNPYAAGNVGAGVLKRFNLIFNYGAQTVIFEPNANHDVPTVFDRSGMWVNVGQGALAVMDVTAGGPAEEAGLQVGDRILVVDGQNSTDVPLPDLRQRFCTEAPGTEIRLRVEREGVTFEVTVVLRDLI